MLLYIAGAAALTYWPLSGREVSWLRSVLKTAAVGLLALAAWLGQAPGLLVLGLALGCVGDFALSRVGTRAFLIGLISFALGHLALVILMLVQPDSAPHLLVGAHLWPALGMVCFAIFMGVVLVPYAGALAFPVAGYVAIILAMGLAALTMPTGLPLLAALCFMASDAILGLETFRLLPTDTRRRLTAALIWPLYWLAQLGFLIAFA